VAVVIPVMVIIPVIMIEIGGYEKPEPTRGVAASLVAPAIMIVVIVAVIVV